ncbi:MAG: TolC family protein [Massilibacteroides sp.]|nr:TolC family protein [Massilibacteroides sp.]MDD4660063.1 TolC family protein [Massilibacteroides sp.]
MKRDFFILSIFLLLLLFPLLLNAQEKPEKWTLNACLNYALEHNIQVKKSMVNFLSGKEDYLQAKAQLFPSLSASSSHNFANYPSSNTDDNNSYTGSYGLNASLKLFDGGRRLNAIKQEELQTQASQLDVEQSEDDIRIALIQAYMQVLYAYESVKINQNTVEVSKAQLNRSEELYKAGSISKVDLSQIESQYSTDKYQLVVAETNLATYKLQLKQLLELEIEEEIELDIPELTEEDILAPLPEKQVIYATALSVMPEMKSSKLNVDISELEIKKAKAGYLPSLSLSAGIGTGHSSGTGITFKDQLWDRFSESVGLTLSIPIFSNRENKTAVNKAKFAVTTNQLELINTQKNLLKTVEGLYLDATSSQNQYLAAQDRLGAVAQSYKQTEEQFFLGMKNTLELLTEKSNWLTAQQEILQTKYMAIMSIQLLNIYQKKEIDDKL